MIQPPSMGNAASPPTNKSQSACAHAGRHIIGASRPMGRQRKSVVWAQALSLDAAAESLSCRRKTLADAVDAGILPMFQDPTSRRQRVLVVDLIEYICEH